MTIKLTRLVASWLTTAAIHFVMNAMRIGVRPKVPSVLFVARWMS